MWWGFPHSNTPPNYPRSAYGGMYLRWGRVTPKKQRDMGNLVMEEMIERLLQRFEESQTLTVVYQGRVTEHKDKKGKITEQLVEVKKAFTELPDGSPMELRFQRNCNLAELFDNSVATRRDGYFAVALSADDYGLQEIGERKDLLYVYPIGGVIATKKVW